MMAAAAAHEVRDMVDLDVLAVQLELYSIENVPLILSGIVKEHLAAFPGYTYIPRPCLGCPLVNMHHVWYLDRIFDDSITDRQQRPSSDEREHKPHRAHVNSYARTSYRQALGVRDTRIHCRMPVLRTAQ